MSKVNSLRNIFITLLIIMTLIPANLTTTYAKTDSSQLPQIYWDANKLLGEGKKEEALNAYDNMIKQYPSMDEGYLGKANCLFGMRRYEEAIPLYNQVIALDPLEIRGYSEQVQCLIFLGRYDDALIISNKAIVALPENHQGYFRKAQALNWSREPEAAVPFYNKAIELCPKDWTDPIEMYNNLGHVYLSLGKYLEAINTFQAGADFIREYFFESYREFFYSFLLDIAQLYAFDIQDYDMAIKKFDECLQYNPQHSYALSGKGLAYCYQGKYSEAIICYSQAIEINPSEADFYLNRAWAFESVKDYQSMVDDLNKCLAYKGLNVAGIYLRIADGYKELGMYQQAIDACNLADTQKNSSTEQILLEKYEISMKFKKYNDALLYINSAIKINPNDSNYNELKIEAQRQLAVMNAPATAKPANSTVTINSTMVRFEAYTINGYNYFKLRDIAFALNGTDKQFEVAWDGDKNAISITTGKKYTKAGGELTISDKLTNKDAKLTSSKLYINGVEVELDMYTIDGYSYFKLRDIGKQIDFSIGWDGSKNSISINTSESYSE